MHHGTGSAEYNWRHLIEAVEEFGQGLTVFDRDLKLILCNNRFLEMLDFPQEGLIHSGTQFSDFMRFNAARGEYGEGDIETLVAERVEKARRFTPHCFERTRPNGDIIEVRGTPLTSGGFVTIYSDITQRKQAENDLLRQTEYLRSVIEHLPQGISVFDEHLRLKFWNAKLLDVLGLPPETVYLDVSFDDLIMIPAKRGEYGPGAPEEHVRARRELALQFQPHRFERSRPNERTHLVEGRPMQLGDSLIGFVTTYTDITDRIAIEQEVRRKNDVLQTLFDNIPGGISLFDRDLRLVAYNAELQRLLDFPDELFATGMPSISDLFRFNALRGEYGNCDVEEQVRLLLERAELREAHKFERARPNGTVLEIRGVPLPDGGFVSIYTDITERKVAEEEINRLARFDSLTGLANRHSLESLLDQSLADARRHNRRLAVLFLDLDRFKGVNDSLGHAIGDELLIEIAHRLQANVRESDIVARLGGDEFVVVVSDFVELNDVVVIVDKIIAATAQPVQIGPHRLVTSTSIGIAVYPEDGSDRAALMKHADIAMYHAKTAGRSRSQFFDETMNASVKQRQMFEIDLRQALDSDEFILHYQPQIHLASGRVSGVEALIRWDRPGEELLSPAAFIPMAEEIGMADQLGAWVLRTALRTVGAWMAETRCRITVAINVSMAEIKAHGFLDLVRSSLAETGLPPDCLTLEIAESTAMSTPDAILALMRELKSLGIGLTLDKFGTGLSSLRHLGLFPLDSLKLDRDLVQAMDDGATGTDIGAASIGLARTFGLDVVAGGVETPTQLEALTRLNCTHAQGYCFSHPLPAEAAKAFILNRNRRTDEP